MLLLNNHSPEHMFQNALLRVIFLCSSCGSFEYSDFTILTNAWKSIRSSMIHAPLPPGGTEEEDKEDKEGEEEEEEEKEEEDKEGRRHSSPSEEFLNSRESSNGGGHSDPHAVDG